MPAYGISPLDPPDWQTLFPHNSTEKTLEVGFGMGDGLLEMAVQNPYTAYIGVEVHGPGVGRLLLELEKQAITNVRVIRDDIVTVVNQFPSHYFDTVLVLFPDPWPKKRQHKRRLIQPPFVQALARILRPGGRLYTASDWQDYAEFMHTVLVSEKAFTNLADTFLTSAQHRPQTKYERRAIRLGHHVWDLGFQKTDPSPCSLLD